jgi:hypothetical protein
MATQKDEPVCVVDAFGTKHWLLNGVHHRVDGPAWEYIGGSKYWFLYGKWHRVGGPAVEYPNGRGEWYINGKLHRLDGPAIDGGNEKQEWWVDGKKLDCTTQEEFERLMKLRAFW